MKKTLLVFIMLSLTITSFSEKKENVKGQNKLEINQSEKRDYQVISCLLYTSDAADEL